MRLSTASRTELLSAPPATLDGAVNLRFPELGGRKERASYPPFFTRYPYALWAAVSSAHPRKNGQV